jgi:hypothetical protein
MTRYCGQCLLTVKAVFPPDVGVFIKMVFKVQGYGYEYLDSI